MRSSGDGSARASGQQARAFIAGIALACTLAPGTADAYELRQTSSGAFERWEAEQGAAGRARAVADYIAGMTDRYAILEHRRLFDPGERT